MICAGILMSNNQRSYKTRTNVKSKVFKVRSSKKICDERLACKGSKPPSHYFCEDCASYQCESCESLLHENIAFNCHIRLVIPPPPEEELCQGDCDDKNFADLSCAKCKVNLCYLCDFKAHDRGKRMHTRNNFDPSNMMNEEEFLSCENNLYSHLDNLSSEKCNDSAILDFSNSFNVFTLPDVCHSKESNGSHTQGNETSHAMRDQHLEAVLIMSNEGLQVKNPSAFALGLGCEQEDLVKVVSIFGNTGDGKSYTLNHLFFGSEVLFFDGEVFKTSSLPEPCTHGVWAAYSPEHKVIAFDTEGFLSSACILNQKEKLLLNILAISDVAIYKTSAERLHDDIFSFLGDASTAFLSHLQHKMKKDSVNIQKPSLVVFHETKHTATLPLGEQSLNARFRKHNIKLEAFDKLEYVGVQNTSGSADFGSLKLSIKAHLEDASRVARKVSTLFDTLMQIHNNYNEDSTQSENDTCSICCISCGVQCSNVLNHLKENIPHDIPGICCLNKDNLVQYCKECYLRGQRIVVVEKSYPSNEWAITGWFSNKSCGNVLECSSCGVLLYKHVSGDERLSDVCVSLPCHIWPQEEIKVEESHTAQNIIDNITYVSQTVGNFGAIVTKPLTDWAVSKVAPEYWVDNSDILNCGICEKKFELLDAKHHCRICGKGFCAQCSSKFRFIPAFKGDRRVCDKCYDSDIPELANVDVRARTATEVVVSGLGFASKIGSYPLSLIKGAAKPSYWVPDNLINNCKVCNIEFSSEVRIHHCRACGEGVCDKCSLARRPVPTKGWPHHVRVCNLCNAQGSL